MTKRGRPRKPTELKKIQGTFRKDRENQNRPEYDIITEVPECPGYLTTPESQAIWKDVTDQLIKLKILQQVDIALLAAYCQEMGKYFWWQTWIAKKGSHYETAGKLLPRPQVKIARDCLADAKSIASQFGFTPASREKINVLLSIQHGNVKDSPKKKGTFSW